MFPFSCAPTTTSISTQAFCCTFRLHLESCVFDVPKKMRSYQTMSRSSWLGTVTYQSTPTKRKLQEVTVSPPERFDIWYLFADKKLPGEMSPFPWCVVRLAVSHFSPDQCGILRNYRRSKSMRVRHLSWNVCQEIRPLQSPCPFYGFTSSY